MTKIARVFFLLVLMDADARGDTFKTPEEAVAAIRTGLPHLERAERADTSYFGRFKLVSTPPSQGRVNSETTMREFFVRSNRGQFCLINDDLRPQSATKKDDSELRLVLNDSYTFAVRRDKPDTPWTLLSFKRANRDAEFWNALGLYRAVCHPLTADGMNGRVGELLSDKSFRAISIADRPDGFVDLVCTSEVGPPDRREIRERTLTLSPKQHCVIVGGVMTYSVFGEELRVAFTREVTDSEGTLRCTSMKTVQTNTRTNSIRHTTEAKFREPKSEPIPEEIFSLAHYQVPEPTDVDARPRPWYSGWWPWAIAIPFWFAMAVLFRRLTRRLSNSGAR